MEADITHDTRIRARDAATRTLNRVTAGVAFGAIAGVGLLGVVSAYTIPAATTVSEVASTDSGSSSTGLQSSSGTVSSSSGSGIVVSGGS